jgi:hypothetical protein
LLEDVKNDVVDRCKREFPCPIIIGGPSVGISGKEMIEYFDLEYAVRQEKARPQVTYHEAFSGDC